MGGVCIWSYVSMMALPRLEQWTQRVGRSETSDVMVLVLIHVADRIAT